MDVVQIFRCDGLACERLVRISIMVKEVTLVLVASKLNPEWTVTAACLEVRISRSRVDAWSRPKWKQLSPSNCRI